jgi:hypothetical protein
MVQEYGRYFGMPTVCFRGGCLTGPNHAGARLHGFLSYLMRCTVTGERYVVAGYGGSRLSIELTYDRSRFADEAIGRIRDHIETLLAGLNVSGPVANAGISPNRGAVSASVALDAEVHVGIIEFQIVRTAPACETR